MLSLNLKTVIKRRKKRSIAFVIFCVSLIATDAYIAYQDFYFGVSAMLFKLTPAFLFFSINICITGSTVYLTRRISDLIKRLDNKVAPSSSVHTKTHTSNNSNKPKGKSGIPTKCSLTGAPEGTDGIENGAKAEGVMMVATSASVMLGDDDEGGGATDSIAIKGVDKERAGDRNPASPSTNALKNLDLGESAFSASGSRGGTPEAIVLTKASIPSSDVPAVPSPPVHTKGSNECVGSRTGFRKGSGAGGYRKNTNNRHETGRLSSKLRSKLAKCSYFMNINAVLLIANIFFMGNAFMNSFNIMTDSVTCTFQMFGLLAVLMLSGVSEGRLIECICSVD
jgi:hypothetical protein